MHLPRILCAVVTYNQAYTETPVAASLSRLPAARRADIEVCSVANEGGIRSDRAIVNRQATLTEHDMRGVEISTGCNGGLALGYNIAVEYLRTSGCQYILFLNADAELTEDLLEGFDESLTTLDAKDQSLALAPSLYSSGIKVSPFTKPGFSHPFAIISFLFCHRSVFPPQFAFPADYWLDGIDLWLSRHLWANGVSIREIRRKVVHRLSVVDQFNEIEAWRYRNVVQSEIRFNQTFGAPRWVVWRLIMRASVRCTVRGRFDLLPELCRAVWLQARPNAQ